MELLQIIRVEFDYWSDILPLPHTGEEWACNGTVHQLFTDFEKAYDSGRREVLYNILTELGITFKLVGLN
jgi:hypothetical protein